MACIDSSELQFNGDLESGQFLGMYILMCDPSTANSTCEQPETIVNFLDAN